MSFLRYVFSFLLGGECCVCCGKKVIAVPLCRNCLHKLLAVNEESPLKRCRICGKELVSEIGVCSLCRTSPVIKSIDALYPLFSYSLWRKKLLFLWKMQEKRSLSSLFTNLIYKKLSGLEKECGRRLSVVPVPPRPDKIREQGWDQIQDLCFYLSKGFNVKILPLLKRNSKKQQKKLDRLHRLEAIGSAYSLSKAAVKKRLCIPEEAVLIDDVLTTGATLENCAALLKSAGVKKVYAVTLFIVE